MDVGRKDFKSAFQRLDSRLAKDPNDQRALLVAGQVYVAAGDQGRAEAAWKKLLAINPGNNDAYDALGRMYANSGRLEAAEQQFATLAEKGVDAEYGLILAGGPGAQPGEAGRRQAAVRKSGGGQSSVCGGGE